ncbi:unnamed protein product [Lactuca virosa]|uniref:GDSL esterase/lipase n=1 Tax=Lactuca virosa TaxID=75947 RepID=A0AAU9NNL8_9ASTR|nr:unnamed protein product [Lactuca virosa]
MKKAISLAYRCPSPVISLQYLVEEITHHCEEFKDTYEIDDLHHVILEDDGHGGYDPYEEDADEGEEEINDDHDHDDLDDELVPKCLNNKFERQKMKKLGKRAYPKMKISKRVANQFNKPGCVRGKHGLGPSFELLASGSQKMINDDGFQRALYMIDIGQNDIADAFAKKYSYAQVVKRILLVLAEIKNSIKSIHDNGGRKFWVHNTGPLDCLPQKLGLVKPSSRELDPHGCISTYNSAVNLFNVGLRHLCAQLRSEMKDATPSTMSFHGQ